MKVRKIVNEEQSKQTLPTHKDFMERMKPSSIQKKEDIKIIRNESEREK